MKAVVFNKYGTADNLEVVEVAVPSPGENEVLVKVMATAVNQADNHVLSGTLRFSTGILKPKQRILGSDIAGVVTAVGSEVSGFRVGDAVFGDLSGHGRGGFAEYAAVPQDALALKPENVRFEEAAAVPMTAVTALQGLRDYGQLQAGQTVLINGASGGVGSFAVQIAKVLGGRVTAVVSSRNVEMVRRIGADEVIDYTEEDFTRSGQYDLVFDTVGNRSIEEYRQALAPDGRFVTATFIPALAMRGVWPFKAGGQTMVNMMSKPNGEDLAYIGGLLESGKITAVIDRCYPLEETAEALLYLKDGHARGKVLIVNELREF